MSSTMVMKANSVPYPGWELNEEGLSYQEIPGVGLLPSQMPSVPRKALDVLKILARCSFFNDFS